MPTTATTWGQVEVGQIVFDKNAKMWWVRSERPGQILLDDGLTEPMSTIRPPDNRPVDIYEPTEQEAVNLAVEGLGGRVLRLIRERERTIRKAQTWQMEPVARRAVTLRDHIDWFHDANVDDVLRRWQGTAAKPSSAETKRIKLAELVEAHDAMHADPGIFPMTRPHVHTLTSQETP